MGSLLRTGSDVTSVILNENHEIIDTNVLCYMHNSFFHSALTKTLAFKLP